MTDRTAPAKEASAEGEARSEPLVTDEEAVAEAIYDNFFGAPGDTFVDAKGAAVTFTWPTAGPTAKDAMLRMARAAITVYQSRRSAVPGRGESDAIQGPSSDGVQNKEEADMKDIPESATVVTTPLVIMLKNDAGKIETHIHPPFDYTHQHYGLLICDLVRHVAAMFRVPEDKVWYWVERERKSPTDKPTSIQHAFPRAQ